MGVPAFFRWLSRKYASIIVSCVEEKPKNVDGVAVPVDSSEPNPNATEFDNLYLDMNGIIHPCCHPENKPAPKNEDEMMVDIFAYIDRLFAIVRPRRVLYMAIDGVAPRAKMNQQRSRRFRAAQESHEKREDIARIKEELRAKGAEVPPDKQDSEHFDSNCITPGTPFMFRLADCLRFYIHDRLNNDPGWKNIMVILSDANVPGEGEHKIMDYIRKQRAQPDHDPNTHHCLCGADADLIMLGLATHEPNFTIIREEFKPNQPRPCEICGQVGHEMKECTGIAKEKTGEHDEVQNFVGTEQQFIFLRLSVAREYLERELTMLDLPFKQDMERAIDDWVLMCFFVGNDFLPHLPSLSIREGAIDRLVRLYKKAVYKTGGYLTKNGFINLSRVQLVLQDLGTEEDEIFKKRRETDLHFRRRDKEKRKRQKMFDQARAPAWMSGQFAPQGIGSSSSVQNPRQAAYEARMQQMGGATGRNMSNQNAAAQLRSMLNNGGNEAEHGGQKRKLEEEEFDEEPFDEVKLWEDGWKDRYYQSKFDVAPEEDDFRYKVANEYVLGLCWVLQYYYQGCPSWKWYFPYHYAPFASDFVNIGDLNTDFEKNTQPFKPLEQLMSVFPAASKQFLPPTWAELMCHPESPIIDFYPTNFKIDLNGKKFAWQGVALLPFVDEVRLKEVLATVYDDLTTAEVARNIRGNDRLFVSKDHQLYDFLQTLYEGATSEKVEMDSKLTRGVRGQIWPDKLATMEGASVSSPLPQLEDLKHNRAICIQFHDPIYPEGHVFTTDVLPGAKFPPQTLKPSDFDQRNPGHRYRPQLGFTRDSGYRKAGSYDAAPMNRHVRSALPSQHSGGYQGRQSPGYGVQQDVRHGPRHPRAQPQANRGMYSRFPPPMSSQGQYGYQHQQHRGYQQQGHHNYGSGPSSWQQQQRHHGNQALDSYSTRRGGYGGYQGNQRDDGRRSYPPYSRGRRY